MALAPRTDRVQTASTLTIRPIAVSDSATEEFTAFFRSEFSAVARAAYLILHDRDAAGDVTADPFAQLLRHREEVSGYERPAAWGRRVAIRLAVRAARRNQLRDRLLPWLTPPQPN